MKKTELVQLIKEVIKENKKLLKEDIEFNVDVNEEYDITNDQSYAESWNHNSITVDEVSGSIDDRGDIDIELSNGDTINLEYFLPFSPNEHGWVRYMINNTKYKLNFDDLNDELSGGTGFIEQALRLYEKISPEK